MSIGSLGAGSGMDLESLVKSMVSAQRDSKVRLYQDKINGYEAEFSAIGQVGSAIDSFKSTVKTLNDEELFTRRDAKIAQEEGKEVLSITTDETASNGSYAIQVNQLAQGSRVMSAPGVFTSGDEVIAEEDASLTFKAGEDDEFSVAVAAGTTLSELRNLINTSEDNFGVSANLVDDGNGNLFFTATSSIEGAGNTLKIINGSSQADDTSVESEKNEAVKEAVAEEKEEVDKLDLAGDDVDFANDGPIPVEPVKEKAEAVDNNSTDENDESVTSVPQVAKFGLDNITTEGRSAALYVPLGDEAKDAVITVDGIQIRNETNVFDEAVEGLSIEALDITDETTKVDISFDQKTVRETIEEFIASYNDLLSLLQNSSQNGAVLDGNSMVRNLQSSLSSQLMSGQNTTNTFTSIFDLGVKMDNQGMLSLNSTKFDSAIKKGYSEISPLMAGENGLATSLENLLNNYTGAGGMTNSLKDSVRRSIDSTEGTLEAYEERMMKYEESLRSKFTGLDSRLAEMNAQGNYLNSVLSKL